MSYLGGGLVFDPWAEVGKHPEVRVYIQRLDDGVVGLTDGVNRIWLDDRLTQVERRCTLTHELVHVEQAHASCQPLRVELEVCLEAARRLITVDDLARVMPWSIHLHEMAEELWVTPQTLRDRLIGLRLAERRALAERGVHFDFARAA